MKGQYVCLSTHRLCLADLGRCSGRASGITASSESWTKKSKFVVFVAAFCIEMYYPSLKVSVGSLSPLASRLDSVALFGENCNLLLVVPENCWCCCNVDEKSCRLLNYPSFVQSALFDAKPREDEVLVVFDDDWSSTERGRKAERQSIWLRAVSGHMDYLSLTPIHDSSIRSLFTKDTFFFFPAENTASEHRMK